MDLLDWLTRYWLQDAPQTKWLYRMRIGSRYYVWGSDWRIWEEVN